jgi:hypothetical protein
MKLWGTTDALMAEFTVSSWQHIGPSDILNLAFSIPDARLTLFQAQESMYLNAGLLLVFF